MQQFFNQGFADNTTASFYHKGFEKKIVLNAQAEFSVCSLFRFLSVEF